MLWPRDEYAFYEQPVVTTTLLVAGVEVQIAPADPDRRVIIMGSNGAAIVAVQPAPGIVPSGGFALSVSAPVLLLDFEHQHAMAQVAWYALAPGAGAITVATISLRRDPRDFGYPNAYDNSQVRPERALDRFWRKRRQGERLPPRRSGLYYLFARNNPDLFEG